MEHSSHFIAENCVVSCEYHTRHRSSWLQQCFHDQEQIPAESSVLNFNHGMASF